MLDRHACYLKSHEVDPNRKKEVRRSECKCSSIIQKNMNFLQPLRYMTQTDTLNRGPSNLQKLNSPLLKSQINTYNLYMGVDF
jgi:hypothetical protein